MMRGYGRDYDDRSWFERAGDSVRGWFGGGRDYDEDYRWGAERGTGQPHDGFSRGYYGSEWGEREHPSRMERSWSYDRDYPRHSQGGMGHGGMGHVMRDEWRGEAAGWGGSGYDRDYGRDWNRGMSGMGRRPSSSRPMRGRSAGGEMGSWQADAPGDTGGWGDYSGGGYGGTRWRNSSSGGVEPGRYFRGYGNGSTGGSGYSPY
jgi:hypothetical protein